MKILQWSDVPVGGVIKTTEGYYIQIFNAVGMLVKSQFVEGGCEYRDDQGDLVNDHRENYYATFGTK